MTPHRNRVPTLHQDLVNVKRALDQAAIVAITDPAGRILDVNEKFCEISHYSRPELIGQDHRIVNSGHHTKAFMSELWQTISTGRVWRGEVLNRGKHGGLYWVDTTIVPFLDEAGAPYQYFAIHYDITARKQAEARLREQATLAQIGEMAAVVAHEVKNPLAGIRGALQIVDGHLPVTSGDRPVIRQIQARLDRVNRMVQDLLFFAEPPPVCFAPIESGALVDRVRQLFQQHADHGAVDLQVETAAVSTTLRGDQDQLAVALCHLLVNAAQAMDGRGTITLAVVFSPDGCTFVVRDAGPGIHPKAQTRLFQPFMTTKVQGRGLGLVIARRVAEQHGGSLDVTSSSTPPGTVAALTLPRTW